MGFFDFLGTAEKDVGNVAKGGFNFLNTKLLKPAVQQVESTAKGIASSPAVQGFRFLGDVGSQVVGQVTGNQRAVDTAVAARQQALTRAKGNVASNLKNFTNNPAFIGGESGMEPTSTGEDLAKVTATGTTQDILKNAAQSKATRPPVQIPLSQGKTLSITHDEMNNLKVATTPEQVKSVIGNALPQNVVDRIAPAIANTKDPNIIQNILSKSNAQPSPEISALNDHLATLNKTRDNIMANGGDATALRQNTAAYKSAVEARNAIPQVGNDTAPITIPTPTPPVTTPEIRQALDLATQKTNTATVNIDQNAKNFKGLAGDIRGAFSGEVNAQKQSAANLADVLKRAAPDEQHGIYWFREAGGDTAKLQEWANNPKLEQFKPEIEQALNLTPQAKEVSSALDEYYSKIGQNAYEQGSLNSVLNDYKNKRLYVQEDQPKGVGEVLRQTTSSSKERVYPDVATAIENGHVPASTSAADVAAIHGSELARVNGTNNLFQSMVDSGLGKAFHSGEELPKGLVDIGGLRALARDEKSARIDLYSQAKELKPIQSTAERLVSTRQSWVRKLSTEINRLNKQGLDVALSKDSTPVEGGNAFKYSINDVLTNPETTAKSRGVHDIGAASSATGELKTSLTPGSGASIKETRSLVNDLVNLPDGKIEAIKSKIATRENKLGPILDQISNLKNTVDKVKEAKTSILDEAKGINSPTRVAVPEQLAKGLKAITEPDFLANVDSLRGISKYQGLVKTVDLSFSLFHHITLAAQALYQTKLGTDLLGHSEEILSLKNPDFAALENDFVKNTGVTTKVSGVQDIMRGLVGNEDKGVYGKLTNVPGIKQVLGLAEKSSSLLFDKGQRWLKVNDYGLKVTDWIAKHPDATNSEVSAAKAGFAREVNAAYGGLNWQAIGVTKTQQSILRNILFAPDWTVSNIELARQALPNFVGKVGGTASSAARAHLFTAVTAGFIATEALNKAITGHFSNENPKGHKYEVEVAPNVYVSVFRGGIGDITKLAGNIQDKGIAQGTAQFAQGKTTPLVRTTLGLASGTQFTGQPITNKNDTFGQKILGEAKYIGQSALPVPLGVSGAAKYVAGAKNTGQPINPVVAATLGSGVSRFSQSSNGLSNRQQAYVQQLTKQGASKDQVNGATQFYLTLKKTAGDRTTVDKAITKALVKGDVAKAQKAAADYNAKLAQSFTGWAKKYGNYKYSELEKTYNSNKIRLTSASIKARIKSIKSNPLYSATLGQ